MKDPFKEKISLASMAFAELETWAREKELLCRICVRDKPKWLPRWIYQKVGEARQEDIEGGPRPLPRRRQVSACQNHPKVT